MIYSQATGGFGNQLYNYSIGFALAQKYNDQLTIDISPYKFSPRPFVLENLTISANVRSIHPPKKDSRFWRMYARFLRILETNQYGKCTWLKERPETRNRYGSYDFSHKSSLYLEGYWQNYRYFHAYYEKLCKEFQPKDGLLSKNCQILIDQLNSENSIGLHIRRGDYEAAWILPDSYYKESIALFTEKISNPCFYIFCEDIAYAKEHYGQLPNVVFVTEQYHFTDLEEFFVLSACRHQAIANSSYSWWAAYLNAYPQKTVIAPEYIHWTRDYYPESWTVISL